MKNIFKESISSAILDQIDDITTVPNSFRLPVSLNNQLDELSLTLEKSKSFLIIEYIKAGIKETNLILEENSLHYDITFPAGNEVNSDLSHPKYFMLNTNYNNNPEDHFSMIKNKEASAFCSGWKEYIQNLSKGDYVFLYQSGVGVIACGEVCGDLVKSQYYGVEDDKYSKSLKHFKVGFKAISARDFKNMTDDSVNFRRTMVSITPNQFHKLSDEIEKRLKSKTNI
jgi:predicted DNA-binding protein